VANPCRNLPGSRASTLILSWRRLGFWVDRLKFPKPCRPKYICRKSMVTSQNLAMHPGSAHPGWQSRDKYVGIILNLNIQLLSRQLPECAGAVADSETGPAFKSCPPDVLNLRTACPAHQDCRGTTIDLTVSMRLNRVSLRRRRHMSRRQSSISSSKLPPARSAHISPDHAIYLAARQFDCRRGRRRPRRPHLPKLRSGLTRYYIGSVLLQRDWRVSGDRHRVASLFMHPIDY